MIPADSEFCPACALRAALDQGQETLELNMSLAPSLSTLRFDHYQILTQEDGTPLELGRGAMGVTYKAIDVNLRCAVALKVINARLIGDESARRRFVREARSAASVRQPERGLGLLSGDEGWRVLLCHGIRGGGDAGKCDQALWPPNGQAVAGKLLRRLPPVWPQCTSRIWFIAISSQATSW